MTAQRTGTDRTLQALVAQPGGAAVRRPAAGIVPMLMPTYVYKFVKTGETIEVQQAFTDEPLTHAKHPTTGRKMAVKKVFTPVGVTFRGDGFYKTDSRSSGSRAPSSNGSSTTADSSSGAATSTSGGDSGSSAAKPAADPSAKQPAAAAKTAGAD